MVGDRVASESLKVPLAKVSTGERRAPADAGNDRHPKSKYYRFLQNECSGHSNKICDIYNKFQIGCPSEIYVHTYSLSESWRWISVLARFARTIAHHFAVNGARYTIVQLVIEFR
jgi:hypothetical protein